MPCALKYLAKFGFCEALISVCIANSFILKSLLLNKIISYSVSVEVLAKSMIFWNAVGSPA